MTFVLHRAERADVLADALAELLAVPPADPFTQEIVAVHSRGVERWLQHRLAARLGTSPGRTDGVCANLDFPFPGRLVQRALAQVTGVDPRTDPWRPERLTWPLLEVVEASLGEPWLGVLAGHLGADDTDVRRDRRFAAVRHLADLYDRYAVHRPAMVLAWAAGDDLDGDGTPLPADATWQAELWRRVRAVVAQPSPAERAADGCATLAADPTTVDLPERLCLFGLTRLPASYLDVLRAIAAHRDVHVLALHPSPASWGTDDLDQLHHPLLRAWGRDSHEMQVVLRARLAAGGGPEAVDVHHPLPPAEPTTLLHRLQAAIRNDEAPPAAPDDRPLLADGDTTVQVHACHGRARQAEVVRDAITHLLADDPTLEPRDIAVLCPDIDEFAPLLRAAFDDADGERRIPYRLADRSLRQTNPVLGAVAELLALVDARLTASQVLRFASLTPVRRRFGFDDDDLDRITTWIETTGIRWGLDAAHRAPYDLAAVGAGTWDAGVQRLLLGVAMSEDDQRLVGDVLPVDDVDSGDIDLAGRFAELIGRLGDAVRDLTDPRPAAGWTTAIDTAASLLLDTTAKDAWQRAQLDRLLDEVQDEAGASGGQPLRLAEIRDLLADRLKGQPSRAAFRTGDLTMCTLVPMRSVPHRVVCLVGLDDGAFPRGGSPDGDDLLHSRRHLGDHDRRAEDRQLLLDAVLAAGDALVVTYAGRDARTNEVLPPAVPVNELLEVVDATVRTSDGRPARETITHHHPLQPSDRRCFVAGALGTAGPWGFDRRQLAGAVAAAGTRTPPAPFLSDPLPPLGEPVVSVADLVAVLHHPVRAFLRQRLGLSLRSWDDTPNDAMAVEIDTLAAWGIGDRILTALLAGGDPDAVCAAELARGLLPPGDLARGPLAKARGEAEVVATEARRVADGRRTSLEIDVTLADGRQVVGTVPEVVGDVIRPVSFSTLGPKHKLTAWVHLVAASASHPGRNLTAVSVAKRGTFALPALDHAAALAHLTDLVALRDEALVEPIPLYCKTSHAYATAARAGADLVDRAGKEWTTPDFTMWEKEDKDEEHLLVLGGQLPVEALVGDFRFQILARRLWDPILDHHRSDVVTAPTPFDPTEPVPEGITVLEASAGTGKTHAVASLVVEEVAKGRPLDQLLVVTFTRKATGTLRERVWQRIDEAAATETGDRQVNLQKALSNFDAATIATTHGFCQEVLGSLGVAGDAERDLVLVEDIRDLVTDAVDDLFIRRFHAGKTVPFSRAEAMRIAEEVVGKPDCLIAPVDDNPEDRVRHQFATTLRSRIVEQKRRGRLITYDDLLARLDASIGDPERGAIVEERLRRRYSMAIVDEFQDTDSVQWRILQRAFGRAPSRLVLVGDPKQAIYAFRGGDVFAYLEATKEATHRRSLDVSWRADQPLLDALDAYFAGAQLGAPEIRHRDVQARPGAPLRGIEGPAVGAPLTVRIARCDSDSFGLTKNGRAKKPEVRAFIAEDLAAEAVRILSAGSSIDGRPVGPGDLAVLTRTHRDADAARAALHTVGIPAVVHGTSSVLETDAAGEWLELLRALEQPSSTIRVHAAAKGPFLGWDGTRLATAGDAEWEEVDEALHEWAAALRTRGVAGLLAAVEARNGLTARLLGTIGGERRLGDLRHIAELLHAWQSAQPASTAALAGWLAEQIDDVDPAGVDAARRRLESDAEAVAVHTIHGAKGLEFPIVLLPAAWDSPPARDDDIPVFHDDEGRRAIGVGSSEEIHDRPIRAKQGRLALEERNDEELRLLYVALTRAEHQVVVWWATAFDAEKSAFARILLGKDDATGAVERTLDPRRVVLDDDVIAAELTARGIAVADATGADGTPYRPVPPAAGSLAVRPFDRTFDSHWVRTSYSGLTQAAHDAGIHDVTDLAALLDLTAPTEPVEVDEATKADEPDVSSTGAPTEGPLSAALPLGAVPGGARVGTLVHDILEHTDFASPDLPAELAAAALAGGARRIVEGHVDALVAGLALAIETPLGSGWGGRRLRDLTRADRLDELAFDLPLAGGDRPDGALLTMTAIADVFAGLPADDPLAGYHERLRDPLLAAEVRGFLNGSIDLVARVDGRHIVVDYKTNLLAPSGVTPTAWHYTPAAMADAMAAAHYPLQAALYAVALHRFLRWRLDGYDPALHLGGVGYLFLRGMTGPDVPLVDGQPCGVFGWHPPASFVTDLSDVLDRGTP